MGGRGGGGGGGEEERKREKTLKSLIYWVRVFAPETEGKEEAHVLYKKKQNKKLNEMWL